MLSPLRSRFGIAGVIAVLALAFAMLGGTALAAGSNDDASASAKRKGKAKKKKSRGVSIQQVRRIARQEARKFAGQGPIGPQGVPGLPGAPGSDGDDGDDGDDGAKGAPGKSVEVGGTAPGCPVGGTTVQVAGEPATAQEVCNGEEGSPWTVGGMLPSGETLTGGWAFGTTTGAGFNWVALSFPLRLPDEGSKDEAVIVGEEETGDDYPGKCDGGTVEEPQAEPGHLCVYEQEVVGPFSSGVTQLAEDAQVLGYSQTGARLYYAGPEGSRGWGTWAVTAP